MIIADYPNGGELVQVEVLSTWQGGSGKLATVRAVAGGQPFAAWTHGGWSSSDFANVRADLLKNVRQETQPAPAAPKTDNLLALALAYQGKEQWRCSETVYLWGDKRRGAYLKANHGCVALCVTGYDPITPIFVLCPGQGWTVAPDVERKYRTWAEQARAAVLR